MSQPSSPQPWSKLDPFFRRIEQNYATALELDPGAIGTLDHWISVIRGRLERYGLDVKDNDTLYVIAATIVVSTHAHVEAAQECCEDEQTLLHLEDSTTLLGYALRELRKDVRKPEAMAS